jgi:Concanavalin A-like lectin/glucanases superfamily
MWRPLSAALVAATLLVATRAGAQPSRVGCGPAGAVCGPAIVWTTTTLPATAAPSWVSAMLAAWMLDEASGAVRVNAQGTTSRDLTLHGTVTQNTTIKQEGLASAQVVTASNWLETTDATLEHLAAPFTCGAWTQADSGGIPWVVATGPLGTAKGFEVRLITGGSGFANFTIFATPSNLVLASTLAPSGNFNAFHHVVARYGAGTATLLVDGKVDKTGSAIYTAPTGTDVFFTLGGAGGITDEVFCAATALADGSICRICSCGLRGELCMCSGTAFASTGRNATACGACILPPDCSAAAPS